MRVIRFFKRELIAEVSDWADSDIISVDQANQILSRYDAEYGQQPVSTGALVLYSLSIFFIGLSIFLLLSHNWADIPRGLRLLTLVVGMLGSNFIGFHFHRQKRMTPAVLWYSLGSIIYGASIFLVGQMYHLSEHPTDGLLWWSIGLLPLACAVQSFVIMLLFMFVSAFWFYSGMFTGMFFWGYVCFLFVQTWYLLYRQESTILFLTVLAQWIVYIEMAISRSMVEPYQLLQLNAFHMYFSAGLFVVIYSFASYVESLSVKHSWKLYAFSSRLWGVRAALITLLIFSFDEIWESLIKSTSRMDGIGPLLGLLIVVVCVAASLACAFAEARERGTELQSSLTRGSVIFSLSLLFCTAISYGSAYTSNDLAPIVLQLFTNALAVCSGVYLISQSFDNDSSAGYYAGLLLLLGLGLLRYIDLIGDYIGGSALFFVFGIIMLFGGYYRTVARNRITQQQEVL